MALESQVYKFSEDGFSFCMSAEQNRVVLFEAENINNILTSNLINKHAFLFLVVMSFLNEEQEKQISLEEFTQYVLMIGKKKERLRMRTLRKITEEVFKLKGLLQVKSTLAAPFGGRMPGLPDEQNY